MPKGFEYRLPTEAEWEYAARGGRGSRSTKYAGSDSVDDVAWYTNNSGDKTHPVGHKRANELGLCDMSGNVWEWCLDHWHENYHGDAPSDGSVWLDPDVDSFRAVRGGSWDYSAEACRCSSRAEDDPTAGGGSVGFRVVLAGMPDRTNGGD